MDKNRIKQLIINLLDNEEMSSNEISIRIGVPIKLISSIIFELKREAKIFAVTHHKYSAGIRKENSKNEIELKRNEWIELEDCEIKIWFEKSFTFSGFDEMGLYNQEIKMNLNLYQDDTLLLPVLLSCNTTEIGKENEYICEWDDFKLILLYRIITERVIRFKISFTKKDNKQPSEDFVKLPETKVLNNLIA